MVSAGVVLLFAAVAQATCHVVRVEEGCCPGPVIEKKYVVQRPVQETFTYQVPVYSKKCNTQSAGVDRKVIPRNYQTGPVCHTQETVVKVPTTDVEVQETPLCKRTCTTNEYVIQIPIRDVTCVNNALCKKTVRSQDNVMTTVSKKTTCAKQDCTQNTVVEKPIVQTVCQNYEQTINKVGTKTVLKPEVKKYCVQLPPRRCLKPVYGSSDIATSSSASYVPAQVDSGSFYSGPQVETGSFYSGPQVETGSFYSGPQVETGSSCSGAQVDYSGAQVDTGYYNQDSASQVAVGSSSYGCNCA